MNTIQNSYCVIMAGGIGSRFWPQSRVGHPKQFVDFFGMGKTLLQQTYERFATIVPPENIIVSTHLDYSDLVAAQLPDLAPEQILRDMEAGIAATDNYMKIVDRDNAIKTAVMLSSPKDIIVIAGKGHENYQIIGSEKLPFNDKERITYWFSTFNR